MAATGIRPPGDAIRHGAEVANLESIALSRILGFDVAVAQVDIAAPGTRTIPDSHRLPNASAKRQREFHAGRLAAADALRRLGAHDTHVPVGAQRAPVWPDGFVGSITHDDDVAIAAAVRVGTVTGIGIDIEQADRFSAGLAERIGSGSEFRLWQGGAGRSITHGDIALFSFKESIFKCLHGAVGRYFDFRDVEVYDTAVGLRVRAVADDWRLAELLPRLRGDVCQVAGRVLSACVLLER